MKKKTILIVAVILVILAACVLFFLPRHEALFDGERISNPGRFTLRFERMNRTDSETMALAEGDALHVSWQIESGHVDIVIGMEGEEAVYRANDRPAGDKADFYVEIPQAGSYTVTVSAREAKGRIDFLKTKSESYKGE
ncbi:MAG: hypothetical protein IK099_11960 [Clostridia bacterium]|nr:hypothetical protein [Clostridia bacterium]